MKNQVRIRGTVPRGTRGAGAGKTVIKKRADKPLRTKMDRLADEFDTIGKQIKRDFHALGCILIEAKKESKHGEWSDWLDDRGVDPRTAARWMKIARDFTADEVAAKGMKALLEPDAKKANRSPVTDFDSTDEDVEEPDEVLPPRSKTRSTFDPDVQDHVSPAKRPVAVAPAVHPAASFERVEKSAAEKACVAFDDYMEYMRAWVDEGNEVPPALRKANKTISEFLRGEM